MMPKANSWSKFGSGSPSHDFRWDMDVLFVVTIPPFSSRPIATSAVAETGEVAKRQTGFDARQIAMRITWYVAADIAETSLVLKWISMRSGVASMGDAAKVETAPEYCEADNDPVPSDGAIAKSGATVATGVGPVRTAEALVR